MIPSEIIRLKRDGHELSSQEISVFIAKFLEGEVRDYQMSAFLMACFLNGLSKKETYALTETMLHSGAVLNFSHVEGFKIDKHSTGGIGDKTSLVIGPIAAACGVRVPMISGRSLGKTGGTLDKLESIPGFKTHLTLKEFEAQIKEIGISYIGQTAEICPADRELYALRDVTATVESIPLICASIMSKKLAEGIDGLVLDVKFGSGAFMATSSKAIQLAKSLMDIAKASKKKVAALITDMNQPLGLAVGNALEVQECIDILRGGGPEDIKFLCIELAAYMILLGKKAPNIAKARLMAQSQIDNGKAWLIFQQVVERQGGDLENLPKADVQYVVRASKAGFIKKADAANIGLAATLLGAGRLRKDDILDLAAGVILHKKVGDKVAKDEALATLHYGKNLSSHHFNEACLRMRDAFEIVKGRVSRPRLILKTLMAK